MLDVLDGDFRYQYRRICRWYSQKFFTPLPMVEALPDEDLLRAFFETQFEDMGKSARTKLALEMTETAEETKARKAEEDDKSDDAFLKREEKKAQKEAKKQLAKLAKDAEVAAAKIAELAKGEMAGPRKPKVAPPPEISMKFDSNGNLEDEECIPVPPPRKR
jgi:primosomal protein N'